MARIFYFLVYLSGDVERMQALTDVPADESKIVPLSKLTVTFVRL